MKILTAKLLQVVIENVFSWEVQLCINMRYPVQAIFQMPYTQSSRQSLNNIYGEAMKAKSNSKNGSLSCT